MSCSLLLYATTDNNASFTFPECQKAAKNLSPRLRNWIQETSTKQFQGKANSQDHFIPASCLRIVLYIEYSRKRGVWLSLPCLPQVLSDGGLQSVNLTVSNETDLNTLGYYHITPRSS